MVLERDKVPMTHVELVRVSFGHLLLQLWICQAQKLRDRAREGGRGEEIKANPSHRATWPGHSGVEDFLKVEKHICVSSKRYIVWLISNAAASGPGAE